VRVIAGAAVRILGRGAAAGVFVKKVLLKKINIKAASLYIANQGFLTPKSQGIKVCVSTKEI
jgi:hypothetical protein